MKAAAFSYACPASVADAVGLLSAGDGMAKPMAGGQSFGPMLNLRLAQPGSVIDLSAIAALREVRDEGDSLFMVRASRMRRLKTARSPTRRPA